MNIVQNRGEKLEIQKRKFKDQETKRELDKKRNKQNRIKDKEE